MKKLWLGLAVLFAIFYAGVFPSEAAIVPIPEVRATPPQPQILGAATINISDAVRELDIDDLARNPSARDFLCSVFPRSVNMTPVFHRIHFLSEQFTFMIQASSDYLSEILPTFSPTSIKEWLNPALFIDLFEVIFEGNNDLIVDNNSSQVFSDSYLTLHNAPPDIGRQVLDLVALNLSRSDGSLRPGDIITIEARVSPEAAHLRERDTLHLIYNQLRSLELKKAEEGLYTGELKILDEHVGSMGFFFFEPMMELEDGHMIVYTSNILELRVSPDMSRVAEIKMCQDIFIVTEGRDLRIRVLAFDSNGDVVFELPNYEGIEFSVLDSSIASVTDDVLLAKMPGRTTITASFRGFQATSELLVSHDTRHLVPPDSNINERILMPIPVSPAADAVFYFGSTIQFSAHAEAVMRLNPMVEWMITHVDSGQSFGGAVSTYMTTWNPPEVGTYTFTMRFVFSAEEASPWSRSRTFTVRNH